MAERHGGPAESVARRHALDQRIDGGEHDTRLWLPRSIRRASVAMRSETISAFGDTRSYGRQSQAGKRRSLDIGREHGDGFGQPGHAGIVARDMHDTAVFLLGAAAGEE